ncbi:MAG: hypothetical protein ABFR75_06710 [Acidobacteriota bacterium]
MEKINIRNYSFLLIILFVVLIIHFPVVDSIFDPDSKLSVQLSPDTQYILSVIEWNLYSVGNELPALYHLNYFYPNAYITFYGHPLFGETFIFFIFNKIFGADLITSYNLYILFAFWIGGIGIFLFTRELLNNVMASYFSSLLFIVYPIIKKTAEILNIFSFFWIGFILYFLIRFWKSGKFRDSISCGFFIFLQGFFSIYHGYFLIAILLPLFFFFLLIYKYISVKAVFRFVVSVLPFMLLLIVVFHPFLHTIQDSGLERYLHYESLVDGKMLFSSDSMFYRTINSNLHPLKRFFPGFTVITLFLLVLSGVKKKKFLITLALIFQLILAFIINLKGSDFSANLFLFLIIIQILLLFIFNIKQYTKEFKLFFSVFFVYNLIFFKFSSIFSGSEISVYGFLVDLVPQFSNFRYLYRGLFLIFPIFIAIAAMGFVKLSDQLKNRKKLFLLLIPLLLIFENWNFINYKKEINFETAKYNNLEKKSDKIILEIPIFVPGYMQIKNSLYTMNTFSHFNYYINGRTAYRAFDDNREIFKRAFRNKLFPDKENIKYLIEQFSVDYIIFNLNRRLRYTKENILERVNKLQNYCSLVDSKKDFIVIKLLENFPEKIFKRRFSLFHVLNRRIRIELQSNYSGKVKISFPRKQKTDIIEIDNKSAFYINFPKIKPDLKGNEVILEFEKEIILKNFDLKKTKKDN